MIEATIFIGAAIIAVTQFIKFLVPTINGAATIAVACAVGVLVALLDTSIGVQDITIAQGIMIALAAVGAHTTVKQIG
jgi:type III secretory pathway component EscS